MGEQDQKPAPPCAAEDETAGTEAIVNFEHPFFTSVDGSYFRLPEDAEAGPVFVVRLGTSEVLLPFPGILKEFDLPEDSADAKMLDLVSRALGFVKLLRPGDPLPAEVVTGEASWEITDEHRRIAYQRLTMQLVTWLTGDEMLLTNPEELSQIADDPKTREKVTRAFNEAAEYLGLGRDRREEVVQRIEELAGELAYIEGLRDLFAKVRGVEEKIQALRKLYGGQVNMMELNEPVARLILIAVKEYTDQFEQIDAQTGEIMGVLKNIDAQTKFIQELRDDLHRRLFAWDDVFRDWEKVEIIRSDSHPQILRRTYRFLAPRFMQVDEWTLLTQLKNPSKNKPSTEMVW